MFYETFFMINNRMNNHRFRSLAVDVNKAIRNNEGMMIRFQDYGWRNTAYPIVKPRVGKFYIGRWFHVTWGARPDGVKAVNDVLVHNSNVIRFITTKIKNPSQFYRDRSTHYLSPEAYQHMVPAEQRQGPVDFSI